jgi:hypothetical protein
MFYIVTAQYVDENSNNGEGTGDYNLQQYWNSPFEL